ncbi:MAG: alpha/beta hydrolase [Bacteroidota bacterium]
MRYLCEFFASDVTLYAGEIRVPVLILRAMFTPKILNIDVNNYIKPQFIDSWERMAKANPKIIIRDVLNSASFIWKDQPKEFDKAVREFLGQRQ